MTKQKWLDDFAFNLCEMLDYTNTSQTELSRLTGLSRQTIIGYLNGTNVPSVIAVINISKALDCELEELINMDEVIDL